MTETELRRWEKQQMKNDTLIVLAALGVGGFLLWKAMQTAKQATDAVAGSIADAWLTLFPMPPSIELLGNIVFPGNLRVPLQTLSNQGAIKQDKSGNVIAKYANSFWKIMPHDASGDWPAVRMG